MIQNSIKSIDSNNDSQIPDEQSITSDDAYITLDGDISDEEFMEDMLDEFLDDDTGDYYWPQYYVYYYINKILLFLLLLVCKTNKPAN